MIARVLEVLREAGLFDPDEAKALENDTVYDLGVLLIALAITALVLFGPLR